MSRRPSNERIRMPAIDTKIWIKCRTCLGDGWCDHHLITFRRQAICRSCRGMKVEQILLIEKRQSDEVIGEGRGM